MKKRRLKRSREYRHRAKACAQSLAERYRPEIAEVFLERVQEAEQLLLNNNFAGTNAPYVLAGQQVVLRELCFFSGPVNNCLIYDITEDFAGLISLWHGVGSRQGDTMKRMWRQ